MKVTAPLMCAPSSRQSSLHRAPRDAPTLVPMILSSMLPARGGSADDVASHLRSFRQSARHRAPGPWAPIVPCSCHQCCQLVIEVNDSTLDSTSLRLSQRGMESIMANHRPLDRVRCITLAALICMFAAAKVGAQTSSTTAYSGQAYVVRATVPPLSPITVSDTGPLPSTGGAQQAALLEVQPIPIGNVGSLNGADIASATAVAQGNASRSAASVADTSA